MAAEPFARRTWPKLMVSWQRLLSGRFRDPLVGRDLLLGGLAGAVVSAVLLGSTAFKGLSEANVVDVHFGEGLWPAIGRSVWMPSISCFYALIFVAILSIMTGILRRRWLGLAATGLILLATFGPTNVLELTLGLLYLTVFLTVLTRIGLVVAVSFYLVWTALGDCPPLAISQWYAGRAVIALLIPLSVLAWGFYVSFGGQPIFGSALREE